MIEYLVIIVIVILGVFTKTKSVSNSPNSKKVIKKYNTTKKEELSQLNPNQVKTKKLKSNSGSKKITFNPVVNRKIVDISEPLISPEYFIEEKQEKINR